MTGGSPRLSTEYFENELVPAYEANGFVIEDFGLLAAPQWPEIESTWATKLRRNSTRVLIYLRARSGNKTTD